MIPSSRHTVTLVVFSTCAGLCVLLGLSCGPRPVADTHWEFLNGPYARNVSALLPSRTSSDFLFAGLTNGDLFSSTNGGRTWVQRTSPAPGFTIHQFVEEPQQRPAFFFPLIAPAPGSTWALLLPRQPLRVY